LPTRLVSPRLEFGYPLSLMETWLTGHLGGCSHRMIRLPARLTWWKVWAMGHANDGAGGCPAGNWTGGWHTFGANYTSGGTVTFYYDGVQEASYGGDAGMGPWRLILSVGVNYDFTNPATMRVDYARVWE
jgi:hypothetical protein